MGAFCCHGNQTFDPSCPKTLCSLSLTPVILHIKFDQDWPNGFRDIQVWKCGQRRRRMDDRPLVYYKLTMWAFGSGQLKSGDTIFPIISLWGYFLDAQGQLTPYLVDWSGRNSNSSIILCMSLLPASLKRIRSISTEIKWWLLFFRRSKAANSVVSGWIWPKSKLIQAFMYVLVTCKYENDLIKTSQENVMTLFSPL